MVDVTRSGSIRDSIRKSFQIDQEHYYYYSLPALQEQGLGIEQMPYSLRVLLEAVLRNYDGKRITEQHVQTLFHWHDQACLGQEIPFKPARIILQDFTGVPAIVDLASMRAAVQQQGLDPQLINPLIPVDLIIDHSLKVGTYGHTGSLLENMEQEFAQNEERFRFLRWAQNTFQNFRVVPPGNGIVHQINLEYLAQGIMCQKVDGSMFIFPDSVLGTDSHTTMINALGIVGWGVGGIEAEAAMLGHPLYLTLPEVIGIQLTGCLSEGSTATDIALGITNFLRQRGVIGSFIEFYGSGLASLSLADRATIANMAPEYGATLAYFPLDQESVAYLYATGRDKKVVELVEEYYRLQQLFRTNTDPVPMYSDTLTLDLASIKPVLAGPKRPQERVELSSLSVSFKQLLPDSVTKPKPTRKRDSIQLEYGSIVLAAITSCTTTSNPSLMLLAGLVAKRAVEKGLRVPPYVKTSFTPGSKVVPAYLEQLNLLPYLEALGFYVDGYGCATCCGNSGALVQGVEEEIQCNNLVVASILSGNRNFEGRIHPLIKANYLSSPPLVIALALAGTVEINLEKEPLGFDQSQQPVYLSDIWPTPEELRKALHRQAELSLSGQSYQTIFTGDSHWQELSVPAGELYDWNPTSTYIQRPPFFASVYEQKSENKGLSSLRALIYLGDSVTTDHISPVGYIPINSPAGQYLVEQGIPQEEFNSYGSRRGNHEVMIRGTFANIRLRNRLLSQQEGGYTIYFPTGEIMSVFEAAMQYKELNQPLMVIAGQEYGTGSSRDWAAKGTALLGVKVVLAESFERIHRSNLIGMGVLPVQFIAGQTAAGLRIEGTETFTIDLPSELCPQQVTSCVAVRADGRSFSFEVLIRLDSQAELEIYLQGGILPAVLQQLNLLERK